MARADPTTRHESYYVKHEQILTSLGEIQFKMNSGPDRIGFVQFLHDLIDEMCGTPRNWKELYQIESSECITLNEIATTYRKFFEMCAENDIDQINCFNQDLQSHVQEVYSNRKRELGQSLEKKLSLIAQSHLIDFNYSMHMVLGSDTMENMNESRVLLTLKVQDCNQHENEVRESTIRQENLKI